MTSLHRAVQYIAVCASLSTGAFGQGPVISSTYLTTINVSKQQLKVYPDTQNWASDNQDFPNRWIFAVQPSLTPELDQDGQISIRQKELERHTKLVAGGTDYIITTRIGLTIHVSDESLINEAARAVTDYYKDKSYTFENRQFSTIPIKQVGIEFVDLDAGSGCALRNDQIPVSSADSVFVIWVDCQDRKRGRWPDISDPNSAIEHFKSHLDFLNALLTVTYDARLANVSVVTFRSKDIKSTNLYAKLNGDGGDAFVSRDDLRDLAIDAGKAIYIDYRGQRPKTEIVNDFVSRLLDSALTESVDAQTFTKEMLAQTYKAEDVDPNEITHAFDQNIDKNSSEEKVTFSGSGEGSVLGGLISAGASVSGDTFKKLMSEKNVTAEFDGKKWIAKRVDIKRVNISKFAQTFQGNLTDSSVDSAAPYATEKRQLHFEGLRPLQPPNRTSTSSVGGDTHSEDFLLRAKLNLSEQAVSVLSSLSFPLDRLSVLSGAYVQCRRIRAVY